jgi:hypothetical protein
MGFNTFSDTSLKRARLVPEVARLIKSPYKKLIIEKSCLPHVPHENKAILGFASATARMPSFREAKAGLTSLTQIFKFAEIYWNKGA